MRVLLLGAGGAVGREAARTLLGLGHEVTPASRTAAPPGLAVDLRTARGRADLASAAARHDVVLNASAVEDAGLVRATGATPLVEVSATGRHLDALAHASTSRTTVVLGAGLAPGLSTVLAAALDSAPGDDVDVTVLLGSGEAHGAAAVAWTAGLAGRALHAPPEPARVLNLREARRFATSTGVRTHLRADFPDHVLVGRPRGLAVRTYLAASRPSDTTALRLVGRLPVLSPLVALAPHRGDDRWEVAALNRRTGQRLAAHGRGQSRATGLLLAHAALAAASDPQRGPVTTADLFTPADLGALPGVRLVP